MRYKTLKKYYYAQNTQYMREYEKRKSDISAVSFNLTLNANQMFFVYSPEIVNYINDILLINSKVERLVNSLPTIVLDSISMETLIAEILTTNEIEGVGSTRKEIVDVIQADKKGGIEKRFEGLVAKYLMLLESDAGDIPMDTCEDVRDLYNEIALGEIQEDCKPDGGMPESKIVEYMIRVLEILKSRELPLLVAVPIAHYLIGYIHPFYDGNGRLSRFISSYMLKKDLNPLIALKLSCTIKENKSEYYKAFDECNDHKNLGDVTPFIIMFLDLIHLAAQKTYNQLHEGHQVLAFYTSLLKKMEEEADLLDTLWLLIQNQLFATERLDVKTMERYLPFKYSKITVKLNALMEKGYPVFKEKQSRKNVYSVDLDQLADLVDRQGKSE